MSASSILRALAAGVLLAGFAAAARAGELPAEKERALREHVARVVAEPDARERRRLVADAAKAAAGLPLADVVAAVRKGPRLPAGLPKARKVAGRTESLTEVGKVVVGYAFACDGATHRYAVDVPEGYDPSRPVGVLLDPGHGTGKGKSDREKAEFLPMWRRFANEAGRPEWLVVRTEVIEQVGQGGARKALPEDEVAEVFDAFHRDLVTRFAVDLDRVVVTGLSQTGFWAWLLAAQRPDRFAGAAPMSAVTWQVRRMPENLRLARVFVLHGDADPVCPVVQARGMAADLEKAGGTVRYVEVPGGKHEYAVWSRLPEGLTWIAEAPRARYPRKVEMRLRDASGAWCAWLRADAVEDAADGRATTAPVARLAGEVEGQRVVLTTEGVRAVTVALGSDLLDLGKPVEVVWNGKVAHHGPVEPSVASLLETVADKADWLATYEARVSLRR